MLCDACSKHFTFEDTDKWLNLKLVDIDEAVDAGLENVHIERLKDDLERYRRALQAPKPAGQYPCPWNMKEPLNISFPGLISTYHPIWEDDGIVSKRSWLEMQDSALSLGCELCQKLVAMIQNNVTDVDHDAKISSGWSLSKASHIPQWINIGLEKDGRRTLRMKFHCAVEDAKTGKFTS